MSQTAPSFIGKRISVVRSKEDIVVTISQQVKRWQETLLLIWLLAWTFCGGVFITYIFLAKNFGERMFFVICVAVWLFFIIRLVKVFFWRRAGREIIRITKGQIILINAFWKKGKPEVFRMQHIFKLGIIKNEPTSFFNFMDNSFWIIGGDRVGFNYSGQKIRMGKQLSIRDAELLVRVLEGGIKEFGKADKSNTQ